MERGCRRSDASVVLRKNLDAAATDPREPGPVSGFQEARLRAGDYRHRMGGTMTAPGRALDQTIILRAQEIIERSREKKLLKDAIKEALLDTQLEREQFAEMVAVMSTGMLKGLRQSSYDLPEQTDQLSLFEIPAII